MRVAFHLVQARRDRLASLLQQHQYMPLREFCDRLGISEATARRDLAALAHDRVITRTHGGALCEFNQRFPSFRERQFRASDAKRRIAATARLLIKPNSTCFFDSGTTTFAIAQALVKHSVKPLVVVTNNLPAAELLSHVNGIEVNLLGGQYLTRQSILMGETARRSLRLWTFDLAFLAAEGMTAAGIWNSQADIVAFQRAVLERTPQAIFCLDSTKVDQKAAHFLVAWPKVYRLLTNTSADELTSAGITLKQSRLITA
jgi:DeoR/GlpR family transcriptional regulator of sugar metabolism